jgi:hypothetical protein
VDAGVPVLAVFAVVAGMDLPRKDFRRDMVIQ